MLNVGGLFFARKTGEWAALRMFQPAFHGDLFPIEDIVFVGLHIWPTTAVEGAVRSEGPNHNGLANFSVVGISALLIVVQVKRDDVRIAPRITIDTILL